MKIAFLINSIYPDVKGGVEYNAHMRAKYLSNMGHDVHIIIKWKPNSRHDSKYFCFDNYYYAIHHLPYRRDSIYILSLLRLLKKLSPDVIHSHQLDYSYIITPIKTILRIPIVVSVHGSDIYKPGEVQKHLYPITLRYADIVTCLTMDMKRRLANINVNRDYKIIPNGVNIKEIGKDISPTMFKWDRIVFCGRIDPIKNLEFLIDVMNELPEIPCMILGYGDSKYITSLYDRCKHDNVIIYNNIKRETMISMLKRSKYFINPCKISGVSNTTYEAMACGTIPMIFNTDKDNRLFDNVNVFIMKDDIEYMVRFLRHRFFENKKIDKFKMIEDNLKLIRDMDMSKSHEEYEKIYRGLIK